MCHSISRALFCVKQSGFEVAIDSFIDRTEYTSKKKEEKQKPYLRWVNYLSRLITTL